jgi:hypothetical protein
VGSTTACKANSGISDGVFTVRNATASIPLAYTIIGSVVEVKLPENCGSGDSSRGDGGGNGGGTQQTKLKALGASMGGCVVHLNSDHSECFLYGASGLPAPPLDLAIH